MWDGLAQQPNDVAMAKPRCLLGNPSSVHVISAVKAASKKSKHQAAVKKKAALRAKANHKRDKTPNKTRPEVTHYDCKQHMGLEDLANRVPQAVRRTAPMSMFLWILVTVHEFRNQGLLIFDPGRAVFRLHVVDKRSDSHPCRSSPLRLGGFAREFDLFSRAKPQSAKVNLKAVNALFWGRRRCRIADAPLSRRC